MSVFIETTIAMGQVETAERQILDLLNDLRTQQGIDPNAIDIAVGRILVANPASAALALVGAAIEIQSKRSPERRK